MERENADDREHSCRRFALVGRHGGPLAASERDAEPYSLDPDHPALLPDVAIQELEAARQLALAADFETGAARRIIDDVAMDDRRLRIDDDLGRSAHVSRWTDPLVESRMCGLALSMQHAR